MPEVTDSIIDLIESSAVDADDSFDSSVESDNSINQSSNQTQYTREDEIRARNQAMSNHRKQQIESNLNASKGKTKEVLSSLQQENQKQKAELDAMKAQIQALRNNIDLHNDKFTSDNIADEERQLYQDPIIKNYYNVDKVREGYFNKAKNEGRYVSPREEWAIQNASRLAEELERYKQKDRLRQEFMSTSLGGSSNQNMPMDDGLADVQDLDQAYAWGLKKIKEIF